MGQFFCLTGLLLSTPVELDPGRHTSSPFGSQYLEDVSLYLTGTAHDPVGVYNAYKGAGTEVLKYPNRRALTVPETLATLEAALGLDREEFRKGPAESSHGWGPSRSGRWVRKHIPFSKAKGGARWIYRYRSTRDGLGVSVAKSAHETEVALRRPGAKDWDFFVYDAQGNLTSQAVFAASPGKQVVGSAPLTCLSCHYDRGNRVFRNVPVRDFGAP